MSFQFTCPQGHLLEADVTYAGQPCNCPHCGMLFIIPWPLSDAPPAPPMQPAMPQFGPTFTTTAVADPAEAVAPPSPSAPPEPELLHIPCPNGHELDTPRDMLDKEVLCPHCGAQFELRETDSVEFKRKKQEEAEAQQARERKIGQAWLNWAIVIAVLVLIGLVTLILASSG